MIKYISTRQLRYTKRQCTNTQNTKQTTKKVAYHWRFYYLQKYFMPILNPLFYIFNIPSSDAYYKKVDSQRTDSEPFDYSGLTG